MPGLSVHVVDVAFGRPALGMFVEVSFGGRCLASGRLGADGTLAHPIVGATLSPGEYEVLFHAGTYFAGSSLGQSEPPFLDKVPFRFNIADPAQHYHLPMKITPWGFALYRGA